MIIIAIYFECFTAGVQAQTIQPEFVISSLVNDQHTDAVAIALLGHLTQKFFELLQHFGVTFCNAFGDDAKKGSGQTRG